MTALSHARALEVAREHLPWLVGWYAQDDDLDGLMESLEKAWIDPPDGPRITREELAEILLPPASDAFGWGGNARKRYGAWVKRWFLDKGVERDHAAAILKRHRAGVREAS